MNLLADITIPTHWLVEPPPLLAIVLAGFVFGWAMLAVHEVVRHKATFWQAVLWFLPTAEQALEAAEIVYPPSAPVDAVILDALNKLEQAKAALNQVAAQQKAG
jgi:hypothetical protein